MPSPPTGSLLVFEPVEEGHALEWLQHLINFSAGAASEQGIYLLAPEALCRALAQSPKTTNIVLLPLAPAEHRLCTSSYLLVASFSRWWTMRRYLRRLRVARGFFLSLDLLCLPLALRLGMGTARLSGILFRPSVHYGEIGPYRPTLAERLRDWRKNILYRLMLGNRALEQVLSLDPFFADPARHHYRNGSKVTTLPDPANPPIRSFVSTQHRSDFVPDGRVGFLLFGHLTTRKGPLVILDALALLPREIGARVAVLFGGAVDPALRGPLAERQSALALSQPDLWLRVEDRRLSEEELADLIARCDVVLAPYQRFVGSSGVLLWAAQSGRPVLAQDYGLIGRLTREHRLGASSDTSDPAHVAATIAEMVTRGPHTFFDRDLARRFAAERTPQRFAAAVLSV